MNCFKFLLVSSLLLVLLIHLFLVHFARLSVNVQRRELGSLTNGVLAIIL
jgi:hypothetical protein